MNSPSPKLFRRLIAALVLLSFLNMTIGCSYYRISKKSEGSAAASEVDDLARLAGNPQYSIPQLPPGTLVLVKMKNGKIIQKYFVSHSVDSAYLGVKKDQINEKVAISDIASISKQYHKAKYFILHSYNLVAHLKYFYVDKENDEVTGEIEPVGDDHLYYLNANPKKSGNYYAPRKGDPSNEIHLYASEVQKNGETSVSFKLTSINKIEIYKPDAGTSIASVLGTLILFVGLVAVLVALTKSSCPFIYQQQGNGYVFSGEIFGGAIYPSLERDDYLPLPEFQPVDGSYRLKITNELLEKQHTNLAELMVVNCPEHTIAIIDQRGQVHTIQSPQPPAEALSASGNNYLQAVLQRDSSSYEFDDSHPNREEISDLFLTFRKPAGATQGKLILNTKNSYWLDYAYGKFTEQFGTYYKDFTEKIRKVPAPKLNAWSLEQHIPLDVSVETEKGWITVDHLNTIGPVGSRDMAVSIDLSQVKGDQVKIRLESGYRFWEVDYAAMDFSADISAEIIPISSSSAIDETGKDVSDLLKSTDDQYLVQPEVGNEVLLTFPALKGEGKRFVFLHSRGYYEYIRDFKNKPDISALKSFRKKNSFTRFSKLEYDKLIESVEFLPSKTIAKK